MRLRSLAGHGAAALVGFLAGALVVLAADGITRTPPEPHRRAPLAHPQLNGGRALRATPREQALVAWAPGSLPVGAGGALRQLRGVRSVTLPGAGLDWISQTRAADGSVIDAPAPGYAIPIELLVIAPRSYARFVPPAERDAILSLDRGEVLLAQTSSELRGIAEGGRIALEDGTVKVAGTVSDLAANGYEGLLRGPMPRSWARVDRFALVSGSMQRRAVQRRVRRLLGPDRPFVIRARGETPFLRYGDAVLPQMLIKETFGEFAARRVGDGTIAVDPSWGRNIVTRSLPLVGRATCHRTVIPQLRAALREVKEEGLTFTVNPNDFGGCYSARFIAFDPHGRLSHHAWGIAADLNAAQNAFGTRPDQHARLVEIMESWGFTWGGRWLTPDGMHFEWVRFP